MPQLRVVFWNIQNFGLDNGFRTQQARVNLIASVTRLLQADILCIQELREGAVDYQHVYNLLQTLNAGPPPYNNWYLDWIKGALRSIDPMPPATYPYATADDLDWDRGHYEGYAVLWNQNIAKFTMQPAPPIQPPGAGVVANQQSSTCRMQGQITFGTAVVPLVGVAVPGAGIQVPGGGPAFVVPAGTNVPGTGVLAVDTPATSGQVIPVGTTVGPGGIVLAAQTNGVRPVLVPAGFVLTEALTLPAAASVVVPPHAASLVMFGRDSADPMDPSGRPARFNGDISDATVNFNPGGANTWNWIEFTRSASGSATRTGSRRPAYVTIKVNRPGAPAAADQLVPIIVYHAPSAAPASSAGMQRSAYSQPMYQAYDWGGGGWINCNNALIGGDFNVVINGVAYAYNAFSRAWAGGTGGYGGGAAATMAISAGPADPNNVNNRSIVALTVGVGGPQRYSNNANDFRQMSFDNIFFRGLGGGVVGGGTLLRDLIVDVAAGGGLVGVPIATCGATPAMQLGAFAPPLVSQVTSRAQVLAGQFGNPPADAGNNSLARRAAEFANLFISDHLPAVIEFNM